MSDDKGKLVPVTLFPRFSSFVGGGIALGYKSLPIKVENYESALITVYRGPLIGTATPTFLIYFLESTARQTWTDVDGMENGVDPGTNAETQYSFNFSKKWFRAAVEITGTDAGVTCWATGFLVKRKK